MTYGYPPGYGQPPHPPTSSSDRWVYLTQLGPAKVATVARRLGAMALDGVFTAVVVIPLLFVGIFVVSHGIGATCNMNSICGSDAFGLFMFLAALAAVLLASLLYQWLMIALLGQTLGKMALGVKVVRSDTGEVPGLGKALGRCATVWGAGLVPLLGSVLSLLMYVSVFFDNTGRNQTWYDKAAGTQVIYLR